MKLRLYKVNTMNNRYVITDYGVEKNSPELQTDELQSVFDLCRENGGTVVIPCGEFRTAGLRMWSGTTLYLESGAKLFGSEECDDYEIFDIPEGVELRTDMEMISRYYNDRPWAAYRRAIISVYGGKDIAVIGEEGSLIDGCDCTDPDGEEGYRGPHGLMITNVENLTLSGYTIANCGNFMHQIDNCRNITIKNVTCLGGSDGAHLHCCKNILIEDCEFRTGDDCIAGINMENLTVRNCNLNTSCDIFRAGGSHILVENCRMSGPGEYPHRMTVVQNRGTALVKDKSNTLPKECGRHNLYGVYLHFASSNYPADEPYHDIVFKNCTVENPEYFLNYEADNGPLQTGAYLADITLENVTFTGVKKASSVRAPKAVPLTVTLKNVTASFREGADTDSLFDGKDENTHITIV